MLYTVLSIVVLLLVVGVLFLNLSPQFGGSPSKEQKEEFAKLAYYKDGKFSNLTPTDMDLSTREMIQMLPKFFKNDPNRSPQFDVPIELVDSLELVIPKVPDRLVWFGHSAFLLQIDGKNILIDPMFGRVPSPIPFMGNPRYYDRLPIEVEKLPFIDLIVISHDHYDHLDYESIQKLKDKTKQFYVPLGVGAHFEKWGVNQKDIKEFEWWEEAQFEGLEMAFTPSRHFSGRGLGDRFNTLWGSWVIKSLEYNIFFSGDSGYGPHFKEIGQKYGPFDFAMLECGQYNLKWQDIHMAPEETAMAGVDVKAKVGMPIHWGAFTLAFHSWTDPVERVTKKARELDLPLAIPKIGEFINLNNLQEFQDKWWENPTEE